MRCRGGTLRIGLAPGRDPGSRRPGRPVEAPEGRGRPWMGPRQCFLRPCATPGRLLQVRPLSSREPCRVGVPRAEGRHLSGAARAGYLVRPFKGPVKGRRLWKSIAGWVPPRRLSPGPALEVLGGCCTCPLCRPRLADAPSVISRFRAVLAWTPPDPSPLGIGGPTSCRFLFQRILFFPFLKQFFLLLPHPAKRKSSL